MIQLSETTDKCGSHWGDAGITWFHTGWSKHRRIARMPATDLITIMCPVDSAERGYSHFPASAGNLYWFGLDSNIISRHWICWKDNQSYHEDLPECQASRSDLSMQMEENCHWLGVSQSIHKKYRKVFMPYLLIQRIKRVTWPVAGQQVWLADNTVGSEQTARILPGPKVTSNVKRCPGWTMDRENRNSARNCSRQIAIAMAESPRCRYLD
jgi:hypothetical protein